MSYSIEAIAKQHSNREEMVQYLARSEGDNHSADFWRRRLDYWWDQNPCAQTIHDRGCVLRHNSTVVGFFGLIPMQYILRGQIIAGVGSTTWRVDAEHRGASLGMFMNLHRNVTDRVVVDTTAISVVSRIYERLKYQTNCRAWDYFFPIRHTGYAPLSILVNAAHLAWNPGATPEGMRVVTDPSVYEVEREFMVAERLEKRVTRAYLKWYCGSPVMQKLFVGCLNEAGRISSYLILVPDQFKGIKALTVVDDFTTCPDALEVRSLISHISRHPGFIGAGADARLLVWRSFDEGLFGTQPLGTIRRQRTVTHWFKVPPAVGSVQKRFSVAEGDWGC